MPFDYIKPFPTAPDMENIQIPVFDFKALMAFTHAQYS